MAYLRKERRVVTELPTGALTVSEFARLHPCTSPNVHKMEKKGKVELVLYHGVLFVISP